MPDTTTTATSTTQSTADIEVALKPLTTDALKAKDDIAAIIAAHKSGGNAAVAALLPTIVADTKQDVQDIQAALPTIKVGYKTSEFWLVAAVIVGAVTYTLVTKKELPVTEETVIATLTAVYAAIRTISKSQNSTTTSVSSTATSK